MDIDPYIANWVLEYLLRQPLEDGTLNSLLRALPLPDDQPNLKKSLLLKKLESEISRNSVSEGILELLEQLEEVEFRRGNNAVPDSMKRAYCEVAVECTVKVLRGGNDDKGVKFDFFETVKRVWRGRIGRMKKVLEKGGLGSEQLWAWKDEIEGAVWDDGVCKSIVKKSEVVDAVEAVNGYIREERERMGPSFLEMVAECVKSDKTLQGIMGVDFADQEAGREAPASGVDRAGDGSDANKEMQRGKIKLREKVIHLRRTRGMAPGTSRGAKIVDSEETLNGPSNGTYNVPSTDEFKKVRSALESSTLELRAVVKDPLPDALNLAEAISAELRNNKHQDPAEDNHVGTDNHVESNAFVVDDAGVVRSPSARGVQGTTSNTGDERKPNLMERNPSAHTYEWEDSVESSEDDPVPRRMAQLRSPRRLNTSPLDTYVMKNLKKRRRGRKWSLMEEDTLRDGVQKYGRGNWKLILTANQEIFEGRTEVDLKDKWRNMTRY